MKLSEVITSKKQLLQTIGLTSAAFLIALPIGAAVIPGNDVAADETTVTRAVEELGECPTGGEGSGDGTGAVNGASNTVTRTTTTRTITRDRNLVTVRDVDSDVDADVNVGDINLLNDNDVDADVDADVDDTAASATTAVDGVLSELGL